MAPVLDLETVRDLGVAVVAGLAVGVEREWSGHASGPAARFAGARTFLLLGLLGGIAGWLTAGGVALLGALILVGGAALTVAAYVMAARRGEGTVEGTTEVAALAVLALGAAAGLGFPLLTSAAASLIVLALAEKTRIHAFIGRIGQRELGAALQFAVLALVILPLLPEGPYGPYGSIRPRSLWAVVLLLSGLSFAGYVARRAVGVTRGYALTGLLGGIVSSTAVTLSFARHSRREPALSRALATGAVGACAVVFPRVLVVSAVLNPSVARASLGYVAAALAVGAGLVISAVVRPRREVTAHGEGDGQSTQSPLQLISAVKMAVGFQVILTVIPFVQRTWGDVGVLTSAVVVGIGDMDALTLGMARLGSSAETVPVAARAIAVGALASTLFKLGVGLAAGSGSFRRHVAAGLAAIAAATGLGLWVAG